MQGWRTAFSGKYHDRKNLQKETGYSGKNTLNFGTKLRRGGGSVTLEYFHRSARIPGEVRIERGTAVVSYSGKIGSESLGAR